MLLETTYSERKVGSTIQIRCCRDGWAEHVACGKYPCGSREGSSCHLRGVSKYSDFMQISEVIFLPLALLIVVIYRKEDTLVLGYANSVFVLLWACWMVMAISHQRWWFKLFPCFSKDYILYINILCRRCSLPGPWPHVSHFWGASV